MRYIESRANRIKRVIMDECKARCVREEFAKAGADYAARLVNENNFTIHKALQEGLKVAFAQQRKVDDIKRTELRIMRGQA